MGVYTASRVLTTFQGHPHQATRTAKVWNLSGSVGGPGRDLVQRNLGLSGVYTGQQGIRIVEDQG